mgnify:CR=1 FL=1
MLTAIEIQKIEQVLAWTKIALKSEAQHKLPPEEDEMD